jgi:hypothetical protein
MKTKNKIYRQGDVLLIPVNQFPDNLKKTKKVTLALGEVTGHHHTIFAGATGYADDEESLAEFINVYEDSAVLTHQEHDAVVIPRGKYRSVIQSEYTPEEIKRVAD